MRKGDKKMNFQNEEDAKREGLQIGPKVGLGHINSYYYYEEGVAYFYFCGYTGEVPSEKEPETLADVLVDLRKIKVEGRVTDPYWHRQIDSLIAKYARWTSG